MRVNINMLISHKYKFIFTKTGKTAGTSVESFFEPYCLPEGRYEVSESRETYRGDSGVVGYRGSSAYRREWYGHMPGWKIKSKVDGSVWNNYFKFTVIRNPYNIVLSLFRDYCKVFDEEGLSNKPILKKARGLVWYLETIGARSIKNKFRRWVKSENILSNISMGRYKSFVHNRDKFMIGNNVFVDYFIRYEKLKKDIEKVCKILDIENDERELPHIKSGKKKSEIDYTDLYSKKTKKIVFRRYRYEIEKFGYSI